MSADECDYFRLLALIKRRKNFVDRETAEADNRPSHFLARRVRNSELCVGVFQQASGNVCCQKPLTCFCNKTTAGNFFSKDFRHSPSSASATDSTTFIDMISP